jgi:RHS repeat-associated protein
MWWDFADRLRRLDLGGGGVAFYTYNQTGQRVRKVVERTEQNLIEERIYLGEIELYRKRRRGGGEGGSGGGGGGGGGGTEAEDGLLLLLERETLHVHDDHRRVAMVETRTGGTAAGNDAAPRQLIRYQLTDHLESATLEVDGDARLLSYEEYSPYGSTTYQARTPSLETPKRYRFTGKERDEESGFSYHGARYLATWLGRWLAADPAGSRGGGNLYAYVGGNPVTLIDPGGTNGKRVPLSIHETWPAGSMGVGGDELYWRVTAPENKQFLSIPENRRIGRSDPGMEAEPTPASPASGIDEPERILSKNWGHTEEMVAVTKEAVAKVGPRPSDWPFEHYNRVINDEIKDLIKYGPADSAGGRARALLEATGGGNDGGMYATQEPPVSPPPEKPNPTAARPPDAPGRPRGQRYAEAGRKTPKQLARQRQAAADAPETKSPAPPDPAPATSPATPDHPAPVSPETTTPVEKAPTTTSGPESGGKTNTEGGGGQGGRKGGGLGNKVGSAFALVGMVGAVGSVLRDVDQRNYAHAAQTTAVVGGLALASRYASRLGVVGKKLPVVGWGLMAYGTYENLSSEEAHAVRDEAKGWVGQYTDNQMVGAVVGGTAQLGTAVVKTVVLDTVRDVRDGVGVVGKWTGLW